MQGGSKQKFHVDDMLKCISTDNVSLKLVHRIDKDTSGLLLLAKENKVAKKFTSFLKIEKLLKHILQLFHLVQMMIEVLLICHYQNLVQKTIKECQLTKIWVKEL